MVKNRFRVRSENHKDRREKFGLDGERNRLFKYGRVILVKTKDESPADGNSKSMERLDDFTVLRRIILRFLGRHQVLLGKRFEADEETDTPALGQQFHVSTFLNPDKEAWPNHFFLRGTSALSSSFE